MDKLDRETLRALQKNGRVKYADLARTLGVAPSTILERVRRLEERGVIRGYSAEVEAEGLGLKVQAFVSLRLTQHNVEQIGRIEAAINHMPFVRACYHVTGRFDYLLHVGAWDLKHLGEIVKKDIAAIPGIGSVETFVLYSEIKPDGGWPIADED